MNLRTRVERSFLLSSVILISACSPYIYNAEVGKFQSGIEQASQMLDSQKEFLSKKGLEINRDDLIAVGSPRLVVSEGCIDEIMCMEKIAFSKTCQKENAKNKVVNGSNTEDYKLVYKAAVAKCGVNAEGGQKVEVPIQLPAQRKILVALSDYASALTGIVDAEDKKALSESASKACASSQQLYSTTSGIKFGGKGISEEEKAKGTERLETEGKAITAVCGLITEIGTAFLDRQRLNVLTQVVNDADLSVNLLANYLAAESRKINSIVLRNKLDSLNDSVGNTLQDKVKETETEEQIKEREEKYLLSVDAAISQKNEFINILTNSPEGVFLSMAEAHKRLKEAVNDPKTQLNAAIESIERFYKVSKDAHEAIKALSNDDAKK